MRESNRSVRSERERAERAIKGGESNRRERERAIEGGERERQREIEIEQRVYRKGYSMGGGRESSGKGSEQQCANVRVSLIYN